MIVAGGIDAWKVADELKKRDIAVILGPVLALPYEGYDPYDAPFTCAAKLHAAGVRFCIRSNGDSNTRQPALPRGDGRLLRPRARGGAASR